jgi:signal transduction histidine kinase
MAFLKKNRANTVNCQIVVAFFTLTALIIALEMFSYTWIRETILINELKQSFSRLKEMQMQMKSASNEFILREKTNEFFFASGESVFLNRYVHFLDELKKNADEIELKGASLNIIDKAELSNLKISIASYNEVFLEMVLKIKARGYGRYGLIGDFDKSIESLLQYNFGSDKMAVLKLQLFVKNYLLTGDENLINNISNEIYIFTMALEKHVKDSEVESVSGILINYENVFKQLTKVDAELGIYTGKGLQSQLFMASDNFDKAIGLEKINTRINEVNSGNLIKLYASLILIACAAVIAAFIIKRRLYKKLVIPIQEMKAIIMRMSKGEVPKSIVSFEVDDLNEMAKALNKLVRGTMNYQEFANNIGNGNLDTTFTPLGDQDILGNSLLAMRKNLKTNISEQYNQMLELRRVNAELDNFTYHASHDLRAPLTSILGLVNLGLKETSNEENQSYMEMIRDRVNHMDILLRDLISISYNNKKEESYLEFDFECEVKLLLKSLECPGKFFDIQLDIQKNSEFISDPIRMRTILGNLISNAFKYYNPDVKTPFIIISISVESRQASIIIGDNGIGVDLPYQEKIYNMFFRATTRSTGTGLGLYIVKSMVDKLKGQISFESVLNKGTTFKVIIPNHKQ